MPVFFKALLSVLLFSLLCIYNPPDDVICNIAIYALMILLSTLSVIRLLNCSNSYSWLLNLKLTSVTLWTRVGLGL